MSAVKFIMPLTVLVSTFVMASCSWDPNGIEAQKKWIAQQDEAHRQYEEKLKEENDGRARRIEAEKSEYLASHPEVSIGSLALDAKSKSSNDLRASINEMGFVTREPTSSDLSKSYVNIGRFKFNFKRFVNSINAQDAECKRISAYSGENFNEICKQQLASSIHDFAKVLKNSEISDLTKWTALNEASYGDFIDYEHASRLAVMHHKMCAQQGNRGYVEMMTSAVPCIGDGDVLNNITARKLGVINN